MRSVAEVTVRDGDFWGTFWNVIAGRFSAALSIVLPRGESSQLPDDFR
jgi:hypothetical protein